MAGRVDLFPFLTAGYERFGDVKRGRVSGKREGIQRGYRSGTTKARDMQGYLAGAKVVAIVVDVVGV